MIVKLPFATATFALDLRGLRVRPLLPTAPAGAEDAAPLVAAAVDAPLAGAPLQELARGRRSAVVVVPDATRRAALAQTLPVLLERLGGAGVPRERTTVLLACGTHPSSDAEHLSALVGRLPSGVGLEQHDARDDSRLVSVGRLSTGLELRLNRRVVEAELVVTIAPVSHHYFAGFGGGPKMIFPGLAGYVEIQTNHARVLDLAGPQPCRHFGCEPGVLVGNPVAEEIAEAADLRAPDLCICLVPGADQPVAAAYAGPWRVAFKAAVSSRRSWYEIPPESHRLVVAGAGGAPTDTTLIQAHKALDAACRFAEPGGEVLFVAALDGGAGSSAMEPFLDDPRPEAILASLGDRWVQYGHTTLRLVDKTNRYRVHLYSRLDPARAARLGFAPVTHPGEVIDSWRRRFPGVTVGLMEKGAVYPSRG